MGAVKSKLVGCCHSPCACCRRSKSDTSDLRELPRPLRLNLTNAYYRPPRLQNSHGGLNSLYYRGLNQDGRNLTNVVYGSRQGVLAVQGIDFLTVKNGEDHHTGNYHLMRRKVNNSLVVRRGQAFKIEILLNRPYDPTRDAMSFIFYVADANRRGPSDATTAAVPLLEKGSESVGAWSAVYESQRDTSLLVSITPSASCIVGPWKVDVDTRLGTGGSLSYTHQQPVYIIFNPWCLNDTVYLPGYAQREEYVESDGGLLYRGVYNRIKPVPWSYAQYEKDVLDCAFFAITEIGKMKGRNRSDPVKIARVLSAACNVQDDNGILVGNWGKDDDDYSGGTHPTKWVGSSAIIQSYYSRKRPVKYAQCWVYAGVLTTLCRSLGIPCRPVTCYNAAHDSQGSMTIDVIVDENGDILNEFTRDSIWNYHVWNEVWMDRPDLGAGYGGWQVIDATPQETSEDVFRCGPASVKAIHEGEMERPYDAAYVIAEVNADKVLWKYDGEIQPLKLLGRNTDVIGKAISTKAIGKMDREDITSLYKYPESSSEERATVENALRKSDSIFARYYLNEVFNDVIFEFEMRDDITIGQNFNVRLNIKNKSLSESHRVKGLLRVDSVTYTGKVGETVKKYEFDVNVAAGDNGVVDMAVEFQEYFKKLVDQASFNIACLATIVATKFDYFAQDDFRVRNPDIEVSIGTKPVSRQPFTVTARFVNPLPVPLRRGRFYIQGTGLDEQLKLTLDKNIAPGEPVEAAFQLTPAWAGRHMISIKFDSTELHDVDGFLSYMVSMPNS